MIRLCLVLLGLTLTGCGFRPVYGPAAAGGVAFQDKLAGIYVPVMPERVGQLMRLALQQRLDGTGESRPRVYELIVSVSIGADAVATQRDNSTSRVRLDGIASWLLRDLTPQHTVVAKGTARLLDGYNIINQQFFAAELENDTVQRRLTAGLADRIVLQLAAQLQKTPS